jgi:thiol-disulfide isomerase/thioredoxin
MRKALLSIFLGCLFIFPKIFFGENVPVSQSISWQKDYQQALSLSKEQKKPVLLYFSGSDWCPHCMEMQHDIFSNGNFAEQVGSLFIFYHVDFPKRSRLPYNVATLHNALKGKYQITGYPSVLVVDPAEKVTKRWVGKPYPTASFIEELKKIASEYRPE